MQSASICACFDAHDEKCTFLHLIKSTAPAAPVQAVADIGRGYLCTPQINQSSRRDFPDGLFDSTSSCANSCPSSIKIKHD
jgi:hypothetical protein